MKRMMNAAAGGHSTATECESKEWAPRPLLAYKLAAEPHKNLGTKKPAMCCLCSHTTNTFAGQNSTK